MKCEYKILFTGLFCLFCTAGFVKGQSIITDQADFKRDSLYKLVKEEFEFLQLKAGDTVADVGSFIGYYPVLYSVYVDSVTFYLNDIVDTGFRSLDYIHSELYKIRKHPQTSTFKIVIGTTVTTGLPDMKFTKVVLRDAFHHFEKRNEMLEDIKRIMKDDASLLVYEAFRIYDEPANTRCKGVLWREDFLKVMKDAGFVLIRERNMGDECYWLEYRMPGN